MIRVNSIETDPRFLHVELAVDVQGTVVTVRKGKIVVNGEEYTLSEDAAHECAISDKFPTSVLGYLVTSTKTRPKELLLLVDEIDHDKVDQPYHFEDGGYAPVFSLFVMNRVTEGTKDLSTVPITVEERKGPKDAGNSGKEHPSA